MCTLSTVHIAHGARWQLCTLHTVHAAHRTQSTLYLVNIATHCTTRALHTLYTRDSAWQTLLGAGDLQPPPSTSRFWFGSTGAPYDWGPVRLLEATEAPILAQQYKTTFRFGNHGSPHFGSLLKDDLWEVVKRLGRRPSKKKTTFGKSPSLPHPTLTGQDCGREGELSLGSRPPPAYLPTTSSFGNRNTYIQQEHIHAYISFSLPSFKRRRRGPRQLCPGKP